MSVFDTHEELDRLRRRIADLEHRLDRPSSLRDGPQHLRILDALPDAVIATDAGGRVRFWNDGARALYGYSVEEAVGRPLRDLVFVDTWRSAVTGTASEGADQVHRRKDGNLVWVELTQSEYTIDGHIDGTVLVARDVTRRSQTETEFRQVQADLERRVESRTAALAEAARQLSLQVVERERAEAETEQFFRMSPSLMMVVDFDGAIERINPALALHLDTEAELITGLGLLDFVHPDDVAAASEQLAAIANGESVLSFQVRTVARNGRVRWVELSGAGVAERRAIFFSGVDVTTRRQTDQALRDTEQRFRELAENVSEVFWLAEPDLRHVLYASPAFEPLWGRRVNDLITDRSVWVDAIHPDDRPRAEQAFRHLIEEGDMDVEYRILRPDGSQRWIHDRGYPVISELGAVNRVAGIASDITDRKLAQQALQSVALGTASASTGDQFFQSLMRHVATALQADDAWLTEPSDEPDQMRVLGWWSEGHARPEQVLNASLLPCLDALAGPPVRVAHGASRAYPHALLAHREAFMAVPLADSAGRVLGVLSVARAEPLEDLAMVDSILQIFAARATAELERLRAEARVWQREEELAHVGRLQTMGEMASGIAHELNQPLLAIMSHAAAARLSLSPQDGQQAERDLNDIELQAERAAAIIHRLRSFVQRDPPLWASVDINMLVQDVLRFMAPHAKRFHASVISDLDSTEPSTSADRILLEQVLVNLINNALEAMHELPEEQRVVTVRTESSDSTVLVSVDDRGPGPAPDMNPFEPFVSTKSAGLGIGLSISRSIIERHQGHLWFEARVPKGCRFTFRLPLGRQDEAP